MSGRVEAYVLQEYGLPFSEYKEQRTLYEPTLTNVKKWINKYQSIHQALELVGNLESLQEQNEAYLLIKGYILQDIQRSDEVELLQKLGQALQIVQKISQQPLKDELWEAIAHKYLTIDLIDEAFKATLEISEQSIKDQLLEPIAHKYLARDFIHLALIVTQGISQQFVKDRLLETIAHKYLAIDLDEAFKATSEISQRSIKDLLLERVTREYYTIGDIEKALTITREISDQYIKDQFFAMIALRYLKIGNFENALRLFYTIEGKGDYGQLFIDLFGVLLDDRKDISAAESLLRCMPLNLRNKSFENRIHQAKWQKLKPKIYKITIASTMLLGTLGLVSTYIFSFFNYKNNY